MKESDRRPIVRLALTRAELALSIGMSTSSIDKMVEEGALPPPRRWHTRKLWLVTEVEAALLDLPIDDHGNVETGGEPPERSQRNGVDSREVERANHYLSLSPEEQRVVHQQEREEWNAAVLASPLSTAEKTALRVLSPLGISGKVRFADLKGVRSDAIERLKIRGFVEWKSAYQLPEGREHLWLTSPGLTAWEHVARTSQLRFKKGQSQKRTVKRFL